MPGGMALQVDGDRQRCDVGGVDFNMDIQGCYPSPQALRADAGGVDGRQQLFFQLGNMVYWFNSVFLTVSLRALIVYYKLEKKRLVAIVIRLTLLPSLISLLATCQVL